MLHLCHSPIIFFLTRCFTCFVTNVFACGFTCLVLACIFACFIPICGFAYFFLACGFAFLYLLILVLLFI